MTCVYVFFLEKREKQSIKLFGRIRLTETGRVKVEDCATADNSHDG